MKTDGADDGKVLGKQMDVSFPSMTSLLPQQEETSGSYGIGPQQAGPSAFVATSQQSKDGHAPAVSLNREEPNVPGSRQKEVLFDDHESCPLYEPKSPSPGWTKYITSSEGVNLT